MEVITRNYEVYEFDELDDEAQERAIQDNFDINVFDDWYEFRFDEWEDQLEDMGFEEVEISFTGFWSQGDGASFTAKSIDVEKYIRNQRLGQEYRPLLAILKQDWSIDGQVVRDKYLQYVHEYTTSVELETDFHDNENPQREGKVIAQMNDLGEYIQDHVVQLNLAIYYDLSKDYDYLTSRESIADAFKSNNYRFLEDGEIFY